jgi:predicted transposase YbfD/YdcC
MKENIMTKLKTMPSHISVKKGNHPAANSPFIQILEAIPDSRGPSCNFKYPLPTILFIVLVTTLCGADDWSEMEVLANSLESWIGKFVDVSEGIPSWYTLEKVFSSLNPSRMEEMLIQVMDIAREKKQDIIAFDGKTLRGTADRHAGLKALHILHAWSVENGICIGQKKVDDKSNEITAMPQIMELLDLKGCIITADALNTQKDIAAKAIEVGADYVLPVKDNHSALKEEIELLFKDAIEHNFQGFDGDSYETTEKSRGRVEVRNYQLLSGEDLPSAKEWKNLTSIGMVTRERTIANETTKEVIYYISSCAMDAQLFAKCVRGHWGIENGLHWSLDVIFQEDKLPYRDRIGAQNLSIIRKIVLGALAKDKTHKCGKPAKRLLAASNPEYREEVLKYLF